MNFEDSMDRFFNQHFVRARKSVEADPFYQHATKEKNIAKAQEIAGQLLSGNARSRKGARELHRLNKVFEEFDI
jgi:hypothetical protein